MMREAFPDRGLSTFDFAIGRANFEMEQVRKLIAMTGQLQHPRVETIRALLERKLMKLGKSRDRFQRLKTEAEAGGNKEFWEKAKPQ